MTAKKKPHHHGDLRNALIRAGVEILDEKGLEGLTLRACAARAGVSHAAPAHHFDGLSGLLTAVASEGFDTFSDYMLRAREAAPKDPRERLIAICRGYMQFARDHPAMFNLMFSADFNPKYRPETQNSGDTAYGILSETCAPFAPVSEAQDSTEVMIWSLIHGLTELTQFGRLKRPGDIAPPDIADILPPLKLRD